MIRDKVGGMKPYQRIALFCSLLSWFFMNITKGQALRKRTNGTSNIIAVFGNVGFKMCQRRCSKYSDCDGINFSRKNLYCELVKETLANLVKDEQFVFSEASTFKLVSCINCNIDVLLFN